MANTASNVQGMAEGMKLNLTAQELETVIAIVSQTGNFAPEAEVVAEFSGGALTPGTLTFFLPWMWRYRKDDSEVPTHIWRAMFQHAYYTEDMKVCPPPKRTVRAYRGATEANREGLSWSLDIDQARYFARSRQAPGDFSARVWVTNIPAERMFARFMSGLEKEITADARELDIRPVEEAHLLPKIHWWQTLGR